MHTAIPQQTEKIIHLFNKTSFNAEKKKVINFNPEQTMENKFTKNAQKQMMRNVLLENPINVYSLYK